MYVDTDILSEHWNTSSLLSFASDVQGGILGWIHLISRDIEHFLQSFTGAVLLIQLVIHTCTNSMLTT